MLITPPKQRINYTYYSKPVKETQISIFELFPANESFLSIRTSQNIFHIVENDRTKNYTHQVVWCTEIVSCKHKRTPLFSLDISLILHSLFPIKELQDYKLYNSRT